MSDLETRVREAVGAGLPQHHIVDHDDLVTGEINQMTNAELLEVISREITGLVDDAIYDLKCWVNNRDD